VLYSTTVCEEQRHISPSSTLELICVPHLHQTLGLNSSVLLSDRDHRGRCCSINAVTLQGDVCTVSLLCGWRITTALTNSAACEMLPGRFVFPFSVSSSSSNCHSHTRPYSCDEKHCLSDDELGRMKQNKCDVTAPENSLLFKHPHTIAS
jgi:hypothetical protein